MRSILRKIGMRQAVGAQLLGRFWIAAAQLVTIALIAKRLTPEEQGFYYTFFSFQSLENLFELGFRLVVLQFASHEAAHLDWTPKRTMAGSEPHLRRLGHLVRFSLRFYGTVALIYMVTVFLAGVLFFRSADAAAKVTWLGPWIWMMVASGFTLFSSPFNLLLEGCGKIDETYRLRLVMGVSGSLATWVFLLMGLKLYANGAYVFFFGVPAALWIFGRYNRFFREMLRLPEPEGANEFIKGFWKFQNRVAASSIAQFLRTQTLTPVSHHYLGAVVAGRVGMAIQMVTLILTTGSAWIVTHAAPMGRLVAQHRYDDLDVEFRKTIKQSMVTSLVASVGALLIVGVLKARGHWLGVRILDMPELSILAAGTVLQVLALCYVYYSRAFKREPLMKMNLLTGLVAILVAGVGASMYGSMGIAVGFGVIGLISAIWAWRVVEAHRGSWRTSPMPAESISDVDEPTF